MLPHLKRHRPKKGLAGVRAALTAAHATYRHHSGADGAKPEKAEPAPVPVPAAPVEAEAPKVEVEPVRSDEPDVVLDVPRLHVDEIDLRLGELKARVALEARVMDLLRLDVGVDAELRDVGLTIKGVDAQAFLKVRLENLTVIIDRVMRTIDSNPQLLERLAEHLGSTIEDVASGAGDALGGLGQGAGSALGELGQGAGSAVDALGDRTRHDASNADGASNGHTR